MPADTLGVTHRAAPGVIFGCLGLVLAVLAGRLHHQRARGAQHGGRTGPAGRTAAGVQEGVVSALVGLALIGLGRVGGQLAGAGEEGLRRHPERQEGRRAA